MHELFDLAACSTCNNTTRFEAFRLLFRKAADKQSRLSDLATLGNWGELIQRTQIANASASDVVPPFEFGKGSIMVLLLSADKTPTASSQAVYVQLSEIMTADQFADYLFGNIQPGVSVMICDAGWLSE